MLANEEIVTMITALGTGIGTGDFELPKLRYHRVIIMTDADVDGAHIRTLLLTFFFRQMHPLVQAGHLYIAQPPLYKAKKGKKVVYLKDDRALTDHLFSEGASELKVKAEGRQSPIEGPDILVFLAATRSFLGTLEKVSRHVDVRVVHSFLEASRGVLPDMHDRAAMEAVLGATRSRLEALHRAEDLRLTRLELSQSEDWDAWEIDARTREGGVDRSTLVGWDFCHSGEMQELLRQYAEVQRWGRAPYAVVRPKGEELGFPTERELYSWVEAEAKKGYDIQRYKGLGEMNPDQLWETTMDPEVRTLVQVKLDDVVEAEKIFTLLMGDLVDPRREFIEQNALNVRNLDI
jgi:DNA gyrase subunit B